MSKAHDKITDYILGAVDDAGQWKMPWVGGRMTMPMNAVSDHVYRGSNILSCWVSQMINNWPTQQWATYRQWQSIDAQVKKAERGTPIIFYGQTKTEDPDEDGRIFVKASHVFNLAQVEGADHLYDEPEDQLTPEQRIESLEQWLESISFDVMIDHTNEGRAYFSPMRDQIVMPKFEKFDTPEHYYGTLMHECVHWTGHKSRLDREFAARGVDRQTYAKEELVAELGAAFLTSQYGIDAVTRDDHTNYIASWLKALKNDKTLIVRAASLASSAVDMINDISIARTHQINQAA